MESAGDVQNNKPSKLAQLCDFYKYLFANRRRELIIFIFITFLLPTGPYMYVALKLINDVEEHRKSYYGDGSMITLCAGILCAYFVMLFEFKSEEERVDNTLMNLLLLGFYVVLFLVFAECQLNFDRSWCFNKQIFVLSSLLLLTTSLIAVYFNFKKNFDYPEVDKYLKESDQKVTENKASKVNKTDDNVKL